MKVIAVIGCGRISTKHFPALQVNENVRIKYACDLIIEKAEKAKEKYNKIENVITDYNVALNDSEVDAVYVLTPNYKHYTITMSQTSNEKSLSVHLHNPLSLIEDLPKPTIVW